MTATVHREWFVLPEHLLSHVKLAPPCCCSYRAKLPPEPDRNEKQVPYFEMKRQLLPYMLRFMALYQRFKLGWIAQQFVNCPVGLGDRLIRSKSMFVLEVQCYRATSGFSVIAMNEDLIDTATNQSIQEGGQLFSL